MLIVLDKKTNEQSLQKAAEDLDGYVKFVVDIEQKVMTIGGLRHFEGEQLLISQGSKQSNLWGGGIDLQTRELDFDSMINIRPNQNNPSREILDQKVREQIKNIVNKLLLEV